MLSNSPNRDFSEPTTPTGADRLPDTPRNSEIRAETLDLSREVMPKRDALSASSSEAARKETDVDIALPSSFTIPDAMKCAGGLMLLGSLATLYLTSQTLTGGLLAVGAIIMGVAGDVIEERRNRRAEKFKQDFLEKAAKEPSSEGAKSEAITTRLERTDRGIRE